MSVRINFIQRKELRERVWKTLNFVVGITTILNVSMVGALLQPSVARAAETTGPSNLTTTQVTTTTPTPATNPSLGQSCGLDIGLVIDNSGSVDTTEMGQMKTALNSFVDAFSGTPTQFSVTRFDTTANVLQNFTSNLTTTKNAINSVTANGNTTNWEDGLAKSFSTFDPRTDKTNLIVIATDGSPNTYNVSGGTSFDWPQGLNHAITEANTIKTASGSSKARIVALGIGSDPTDPQYPNTDYKLQDIAGPSIATTPAAITTSTDVIKVTDFTGIGTALASYAKALCGGKILVQKQFDTNGDGQADVTSNNALLSGYTFATNSTSKTTDNTGSLQFDNVLNGTGYSVTETPTNGTKLVSASCVKGNTAVGTPDLANNRVTGLSMGTDETISCTFLNGYATGSLKVTKVVSGGTATADQFGFRIGTSGSYTYPTTGQNYVIFNNLPAGPVSVSETVGALPYHQTASTCGNVTIVAGTQATCSMTNTRDTGNVSFHKVIDNQPNADVSGFTFHANGAVYHDGSSATLQTGSYDVTEDATTGYALVGASGICSYNPTNGHVTMNVGANGGVCTITNHRIQGHVTFVKVVANQRDANLSSFVFTTNGHDYHSGDSADINTGNYALTENAVPNYHFVSASGICSTDDKGNITLNVTANGGTCTITNARDIGSITVDKMVDQANGQGFVGITGDNTPFRWQLNNGSDNYMGSSIGDLPTGSNYSVTENVNAVPGYHFVGWFYNNQAGNQGLPYTCTNPQYTTLPSGLTVTTNTTTEITLCNARDTGTLTVHKIINGSPITEGWFWNYNSGAQHLAMGSSVTLPTGTYTVNEEQHADYHNVSWSCNNDTKGTGESFDVAVTTGGVDCWFTNARDTGSLSGYKWNDLNGNGVWDAGEPALQGWNIFLSNGMDTWTDASGKYTFANIETGAYNVTESMPSGWINTNTGNALNPSIHVTVVKDQTATDVNFGNFKLGSISGFKFDTHESKLDGWTICLVPWNDTAVRTSVSSVQNCVVTGAGEWPLGYYEFSGLHAGTYKLYEQMQTGWTNVFPTEHSITVVSGTDESIDFQNRELLPDLTVSKTDGVEVTTHVPGATYAYTMVVTNQGEYTANNVTAVDNLPAHMTYVSSTVDGVPAVPDMSGSMVTWHLGTMSADSSHTIVMNVRLDALFPNGTTNIDNVVAVATTDTESDVANNAAHDLDTVSAAPTIDFQKSGPATVTAGQNIMYTMTWSVGGNSPVTAAIITDTVPANTSFVTSTCGTTLGTCTMNAASGTVTWNLGTRNPGDSGTVTMTVKAASPVANGTVVTNTATFDTNENTPVEKKALTTIQSAPILTITKSNSVVGYTNPGKQVTYTVTVSNSSTATDTAHAVVLTDILPAGFTYTVGGGTTKTFALGEIAPGASVVTTYQVDIASTQTAGIYTNTASAKGTNTIAVVATSPVDVRVPSVLGATITPELILKKTVKGTTVNAGGTATYTVTISNTGTADLTNVVLKDTLPKGFTFTDTGKATRSWTIGTLKAHHERVINYIVRVDATVKAGKFDNKAIATSAELDPQMAVATVTVKAPRVLGLATTGASMNDYLFFAFGALMLGLGGFWTLRLGRRSTDGSNA